MGKIIQIISHQTSIGAILLGLTSEGHVVRLLNDGWILYAHNLGEQQALDQEIERQRSTNT